MWAAIGRQRPQSQGYGEVYVTTDEGHTWQSRTLTASSTTYGSYLHDVWVVDNETAWAVIENRNISDKEARELRKTTTGITGFTQVPNPAGPQLRFIRAFSASIAVAAVAPLPGGATWPFLRTTDGGQTWVPVAQAPIALASDEPGEAVVLGNHLWIATRSGQVLHTADAGQTWTSSPTGLGTELRGVAFQDTQRGLAYGGTRLMSTMDSGHTWIPVTYTGPARTTHLIAVPNAVGSYLSVGDSYNSTAGPALSTDYGLTWRQLESTMRHSKLAASSPTRVWASEVAEINSQAGGLVRYASIPLATRQTGQSESFVYPNPTTGQVYLPAAGPFHSAVIYDALGKQRRLISLEQHISAHTLQELGPGIYEVLLLGNRQRQSVRLVVIR